MLKLVPLICLVLLGGVLLGQKPAEPTAIAGGDGNQIYNNAAYGFQVAIPASLVINRQEAPAPQHGFGIAYGGRAETYLWVNGEYDVLGAGSVDEVADGLARRLGKKYSLHVAEKKHAALGGLDGCEVILRGRDDLGGIRYLRFRVALRLTSTSPNITYTIGLQQKDEDSGGNQVFDKVVRGFQLLDLPK